MFSLHETTRTWWCRAAFFALCLVPTCAVTVWCVAAHLPSYRRAHERAISQRLGWRARLGKASSPRPGLLLYEGLELSDPDTGQLLAHVPFAEVDTRGARAAIRLPFPATVSGLRAGALLQAAARLMRADEDGKPFELAAQTVTLHLTGGDQTLTEVAGKLDSDEAEPALHLTFRLAQAGAAAQAVSSPAAAELTIVEHRGTTAGRELHFATGGTPLPCRLLSSSWPAVRRLGKASTFAGRIRATEHSGRWELQVSGRVERLDLERLLAALPHELTGTASLELEHATVDHDRLESAAGRLSAGPGTISRSLIHAAQENLQLPVSRDVFLGRENRLPYRQLSLAFTIDQTGLALGGRCPQAPGAVLVDDTRILLGRPPAKRQPVVHLLRALVPQTAVQVPATRETSPLAAFLPVPPLVPPAGSEQPLPHARAIRVAPN